MNFALDALWWRLQTPAVRDLASLLTAPAPWHSGCELPVPLLLGSQGFRYLLALDQQPEELERYLQPHRPFHNRLGLYAEYLLAFWFSHAPHTRLLLHHVWVQQQKQQIGELDFIVRINNKLFHIELACKYYGMQGAAPEELAGLNPTDRWQQKAIKIRQQLALSLDDKVLGMPEIAAENLSRATVIRGMIFTPDGETLSEAPFNALGWSGDCVRDWDAYQPDLPPDHDLFYTPLGRMNLLSPARVSKTECQPYQHIRQEQGKLIALLQPRPDGFMHEIRRIMKF